MIEVDTLTASQKWPWLTGCEGLIESDFLWMYKHLRHKQSYSFIPRSFVEGVKEKNVRMVVSIAKSVISKESMGDLFNSLLIALYLTMYVHWGGQIRRAR